MQHLELSFAVRPIQWPLGVKWLIRVKEERNTVRTVNRRKLNWIGHSWRRKWLREHAIEGKIVKKDSSDGRMWKNT